MYAGRLETLARPPSKYRTNPVTTAKETQYSGDYYPNHVKGTALLSHDVVEELVQYFVEVPFETTAYVYVGMSL